MKNFKFALLNLLLLGILFVGCSTGRKYVKLRGDRAFRSSKQYYGVLHVGENPINKAARFARKKQYLKAHNVLNDMIKTKTNVDGAYFFKGYLYLLEDKYELTRFMYEKIKKNEVYISAVNNNLGIIALREEDYDKAFYFFSKAIEDDPVYFPALTNRAFLFIKHGLYQKAHDDLKKAIKYVKNDNDVLIAYGIAQRGINKFKEAEKTFLKALGNRMGMYNLGILYYEDLKDWDKAISTLKKYLVSGKTFGRMDMAKRYLKRAKAKLIR